MWDSHTQMNSQCENKSIQASVEGHENRTTRYKHRTITDKEELQRLLVSNELKLFLNSSVSCVEECLRENSSFDALNTEFERLAK